LLRRVIGEDIELLVKAKTSCRRPADRGQLEQIIVNLAVPTRGTRCAGGRLTLELASAVVDEAFVRRTPDAVAALTSCGRRDSGVAWTSRSARRCSSLFTTKDQGKARASARHRVRDRPPAPGFITWRAR